MLDSVGVYISMSAPSLSSNLLQTLFSIWAAEPGWTWLWLYLNSCCRFYRISATGWFTMNTNSCSSWLKRPRTPRSRGHIWQSFLFTLSKDRRREGRGRKKGDRENLTYPFMSATFSWSLTQSCSDGISSFLKAMLLWLDQLSTSPTFQHCDTLYVGRFWHELWGKSSNSIRWFPLSWLTNKYYISLSCNYILYILTHFLE